jgi:hypothetical protein
MLSGFAANLRNIVMKKLAVNFVILCIGFVPIWPQNNLKHLIFNRTEIEIPINWSYSTNPNAKDGTDQIMISSEDENNVIYVTVVKRNSEGPISQNLRIESLSMLRGLSSMPEFSNCSIGGGGKDEFYGKIDGESVEFKFINNNTQKIVGILRYYGKIITKTNEVLYIAVIIVGIEPAVIEQIISSIKIIE